MKNTIARRLACCATPALAQNDTISLKGAIDIHVHQDPDSAPRAIDADDVARQAKAAGMRAVVLKNHWEDTASLAYMVRKIVPGIEVFGGITQDMAVGGINIEAVKHMADMKGGYGRIVWLPTFDAQNQVKDKGPEVKVSENGKLLPSRAGAAGLYRHPQAADAGDRPCLRRRGADGDQGSQGPRHRSMWWRPMA